MNVKLMILPVHIINRGLYQVKSTFRDHLHDNHDYYILKILMYDIKIVNKYSYKLVHQ